MPAIIHHRAAHCLFTPGVFICRCPYTMGRRRDVSELRVLVSMYVYCTTHHSVAPGGGPCRRTKVLLRYRLDIVERQLRLSGCNECEDTVLYWSLMR